MTNDGQTSGDPARTDVAEWVYRRLHRTQQHDRLRTYDAQILAAAVDDKGARLMALPEVGVEAVVEAPFVVVDIV